MTPQIDTEARRFGRPFDTPSTRFGLDADGNPIKHIVRDEIPAVKPEVLDLVDAAEQREAVLLAQLAQERRGEIAVADTVLIGVSTLPESVDTSQPPGLYL